ncbi:flagellar type III secretion system protein FlhB [Sandaracinobacter neustonicus]|uniref:Flagellar type III secretion system protein FlhB n=1 Tax=Sandaracinobacter neustonicus TaxID=1715348 RepID=A0A501XHW9_9SPHN|nr:EscU/YscU/HrcU family type III secretion system export apparatus switch protein [Sandaracinobacter neustonicus]TPE60136.1 flagellar type III secretion system protein FlhB [Sandaracinobacter neustonicus]
MADDNRTEAPTQRRKQDALEKGDRLLSRDLATAVAGLAGFLWLWSQADTLAARLSAGLANALSFAPADVRRFTPVERAVEMVAPLAIPIALLGALLLLAAAVGQAASGGIGFVPGLLAPKPERLNPLAGLKRLFGSRGLIELAKSILKAALLLGVSTWFLRGHQQHLASLSALPFEAAVQQAARLAGLLLLWLGAGLAFIAGIDLPVQLFQWLKKLRMSKQDIRDEHKQQEGSPEMKAAIRRAARDAIRRSNRAGMAEATVVVTNPTHFAVALRYRPDADSAPTIVARGRGTAAEVIREMAAAQATPILSYPSVARALYFTGKVGQLVRPDLYTAVATILAFVLRVGAQGEPPPAEAPASALFDENGRRAG